VVVRASLREIEGNLDGRSAAELDEARRRCRKLAREARMLEEALREIEGERLTCEACGARSRSAAAQWRAYVGREDDDSTSVVVLCPDCAPPPGGLLLALRGPRLVPRRRTAPHARRDAGTVAHDAV
jgi:hypothetical protein